MAGLTKEQRAAKAALQDSTDSVAPIAASDAASVLMERDGITAEVANNASVEIMKALGWRLAN